MLHVFGCLSYAFIVVVHCHKFEPQARKCAFLDFIGGMKGFTLLDVHAKEIFVSHNVIIMTLNFPFT